MKKFNIQDKLEAIKMYQEGIRSKEIFSKLFPEVNTSKYQRDYTSKTISLWRRTQGKGLKIDKFRKAQKKLKALEMEVAILKKESVLFPLLRKELKLKRKTLITRERIGSNPCESGLWIRNKPLFCPHPRICKQSAPSYKKLERTLGF